MEIETYWHWIMCRPSADAEIATLFPKAARLRNLTYSAPLYVDVTKRAVKKGDDGEEVTKPKISLKFLLEKYVVYLFIIII